LKINLISSCTVKMFLHKTLGGGGAATRPLSEGWGRGGTQRRPNSRATPQGLNQRSKMEEVVLKMARRRLGCGSIQGPTSRRLNVVVRSPPLYLRGGPKWRDNYPEGPDNLVAPKRLHKTLRPAA